MGRFDKLPGIDSEKNTKRRNVLVGGIYAFLGLGAIGAITGDGDEEEGANGENGAEDDGTDDTTPAGDTDDDDDDEEDVDEDDEEDVDPGPAALRVGVVDETSENPPTEDAEVWIRGEGSWFFDVEFGGDTLEDAGEFDRHERDSFFIYPDGRDGVEIEVEFELDEDYIHSPRDTISIAIYDDEVTVRGAPIETAHGQLELAFDRPVEEEEVTQPDTQSFSGSGQAVEDGIDIEGGLTVIEATHDGNSNFQVSLVDDGEFDDNFVNVIGEFDGAQADYIDAGEYLLDVNADGNWTVDVVQPRAASGDALPQSLSGEGPDVIGPIEFEGTGVATGSHDGESNFQVEIYELDARFSELVFNEIGEFDGETTYSANGVTWVDVNADGSWSVDFE